MRIKKTSQTTASGAQSVNTYSESTENTYSCDYVNKLNTYSTDEIRIGTWMGKPLYRKVFELTVENDSNIFYHHNLANIGMIRVNQGDSFVYDGSESLPATWYYSSSDWGRTWANATEIRFRSPSSLGNRTLYAIIEYTKTTD